MADTSDCDVGKIKEYCVCILVTTLQNAHRCLQAVPNLVNEGQVQEPQP